MHPFKIALCAVTLAAGLFLAFKESAIKEELTNGAPELHENVSEMTAFNEIRKGVKRERLLETLPHEKRSKLRMITNLKLLCVLAFMVEIVFL